ncbi:MAG: hypothetical protein QM710_14930 [Flavobacterium sp.]
MNKIIPIIAFLFLASCMQKKKENPNIQNEKRTMKKFDIEEFKAKTNLQDDGKRYEYVKNDSVFKLMENKNSFYEESKKVDEKIKSVANYDKEDFHIINSAKYFYRIPIGKTLFYNKEGQIINEIDNDADYAFSVYDLINKVKTTHNIDLNTSPQTKGVDRLFDETFNRYIYSVNYQKENEPVKYIIIDAQTGEILKEGILTINR